MTNITIPYLCGGTFLVQILRARPRLATATEHTKCKKESLSEQETFRRLISIFQLSDFLGGTSLKTYTSQFKSCTNSLEAYTQFSDYDLRRQFDKDIKSTNSKALQMTSEFVQEFIDSDKYIQLIRSLLGLIDEDKKIDDNEGFFIDRTSIPTKKKDLKNIDTFYIEPFILGIWHYVIIHRYDKNEEGKATYNSWYPSRNKYCGTIGESIDKDVDVKNIKTISSAFENTDDELKIERDSSTTKESVASEITNQTMYAAKFQNFASGVVQAETIQNLTIKFDD